MTGLAGLFNSGKAAVQLNVGPLVVPLTKAQYSSPDRKLYPLPRLHTLKVLKFDGSDQIYPRVRPN